MNIKTISSFTLIITLLGNYTYSMESTPIDESEINSKKEKLGKQRSVIFHRTKSSAHIYGSNLAQQLNALSLEESNITNTPPCESSEFSNSRSNSDGDLKRGSLSPQNIAKSLKKNLNPTSSLQRNSNDLEIIAETEDFDYSGMISPSNINNTDQDGHTLLIDATLKKNIPKITWLLKQPNININHQDNMGNTALHYAALFGFIDITKLLVQDYRTNSFIHNKNTHNPQRMISNGYKKTHKLKTSEFSTLSNILFLRGQLDIAITEYAKRLLSEYSEDYSLHEQFTMNQNEKILEAAREIIDRIIRDAPIDNTPLPEYASRFFIAQALQARIYELKLSNIILVKAKEFLATIEQTSEDILKLGLSDWMNKKTIRKALITRMSNLQYAWDDANDFSD